VARGYVPLLLLVAGIWGASFMFIEIAGDELEPAPMMALRLLFAGLVLLPVLLLQEGLAAALRGVRAAGLGLVVLGFANNALPFTLIAWGQQHIDSGVAAIANAPVPIFVALLAIKFRPSERVSGLRLVGVALGFLGVGVLAGFQPEGGWLAVVGTLAVVAAALSYAASNLYAQSRFGDTQPLLMVAVSSLAGALILAPLAVAQTPGDLPGWETWASVAALGVGGTAIALILYYRMLAAYGASRSSLVTYLIPPVALVYGVTILDEPLTANALAGLVLVLTGVALGSGVFRLAGRRRREVVPAAPRP
jgi:drug/metabolite transporter (DMT)-like permease